MNTAPRGGRPKLPIPEITRRKVRRLLAADPKAGWPAIQQSTGLSESLSRRVLKEERAPTRDDTPKKPEARREPGSPSPTTERKLAQMGSVVERLARARLEKVLTGYAGPCQMQNCPHRATVKICWAIAAFGETHAWYCDDHAPEEAIEATA